MHEPTPHTRTWWNGRLAPLRADGIADATIVATVKRSDAGSRPLLCIADDGQRYWVKFSNNPQSTQTLIPEAVVPALGALIGAPTIAPARLAVPKDLVGETYDNAGLHRIPPGLAHGSPLVENVAAREDELDHALRDDNQRRIAALLVLWDWGMGADPQWLYDEDLTGSIWSFDHGFWLNTGEGPWTERALHTLSTQRWPFEESIPRSLDASTFLHIADRLDEIGAEDVLSAVSHVPRQWEASDAVLEALAWCLYTRIPGVAARARNQSVAFARGGRR